jgi:hypothetical protein
MTGGQTRWLLQEPLRQTTGVPGPPVSVTASAVSSTVTRTDQAGVEFVLVMRMTLRG